MFLLGSSPFSTKSGEYIGVCSSRDISPLLGKYVKIVTPSGVRKGFVSCVETNLKNIPQQGVYLTDTNPCTH